MLFTLLCFNNITIAKADSGWDSSYDSGGSWSGGSSWDSGSSYDYGSSYGSGSSFNSSSSPASISIGVLLLVVIIVISIISSKRQMARAKLPETIINNNTYNDISDEELSSIDNSKTVLEFKDEAFNIYKDIQTAWMNFDNEEIRKLTTDELFNMYCSQLTTLKVKKQQNIMKDIKYIDAKVISAEVENKVVTVKVYMKVECYDYVISTSTNKTIRGTDNHKMEIEYILTFIKSSEDDNKIEKCPNCGAPVDIVASATCSYCNSVLTKTASSYVLSKKQSIGQRVK